MVDLEFAARISWSGKFGYGLESDYTLTEGTVGYNNFFDTLWPSFLADDSLFINGVLHLRADLRVVEEQPELET